MTGAQMKTALSIWVLWGTSSIGLISLVAVPVYGQSVVLTPGATVPLPSSTAAMEPDLAGVVLLDKLIPFDITSAGGQPLCRGQLQNRVVRSNKTGLLHFYYRIRGTVPNLPGRITTVGTVKFFDALKVAYRLDGLGTVNPAGASRSSAGELVTFDFKPSVLRCDAESRFFFIKTNAKQFAPGGQTRLVLGTGEVAALETVIPVP